MVTLSVSMPLVYTFLLLVVALLVQIVYKNQAKDSRCKPLLAFDENELSNHNLVDENLNRVDNQNLQQDSFPSLSSARVANDDGCCSCPVRHE